MRTSSVASVFVTSPTTSPAAKAPSTMSNPNSLARNTRPKSTTSARRTAAWPLEAIASWMAATMLGVRARVATTAVSTEMTDERDQQRGGDAGRARPVSTRATTSGPNSPATPAARTNGPSGRFELAGVAQDRHQRPDRRRADRDADQLGREHEVDLLEAERDPETERKGDQPAVAAELRREATDAVEVDLEAAEEEEEGEADGAEELDDAHGLGEPQHLRADQDAERDLGNDRRQAEPVGQVDDQGRQRRGDEDHHERLDVLGHVCRVLLDDEHVRPRVALHLGGDVFPDELREEAVMVRADDDERRPAVPGDVDEHVRRVSRRPEEVGGDALGGDPLPGVREHRLELLRDHQWDHPRRAVVQRAEVLGPFGIERELDDRDDDETRAMLLRLAERALERALRRILVVVADHDRPDVGQVP